MCLISRGSYLHSFNAAFLIFCKAVTFALKSRWGSVWQFFTEAGVGITIRSQTLSIPMSILGVCAQWHSKFSNILVVCADRWTRVGFKSVTNYTGRPAFSVQFFKGKKKAPRCFTLSVSCSLTGLKSAQSVRMTKLKHSAGGKKKKQFSTTGGLSQGSVTPDAKIFKCNNSFKVWYETPSKKHPAGTVWASRGRHLVLLEKAETWMCPLCGATHSSPSDSWMFTLFYHISSGSREGSTPLNGTAGRRRERARM